MALDKVLGKIQAQIKELAPTLELFVEDSIHPSVKDCEKLQTQLNALEENLAIYKYSKLEKELSPSFNIHAKVSEVKVVEPVIKQPEIKQEEKKIEPAAEVKIEPVVETVIPEKKTEPIAQKTLPPLSVGINDKFRFINELFKQNGSEYNIAIEQLETLKNWNDAEIYLNSLKPLYEWKDNSEVVVYFYSVIKKRFS